MTILRNLVILLLVVGALNWGLVGIWDLDLVQVLFGSWPGVVRTVYVLVGIAGVLALVPMVTKMVKH